MACSKGLDFLACGTMDWLHGMRTQMIAAALRRHFVKSTVSPGKITGSDGIQEKVTQLIKENPTGSIVKQDIVGPISSSWHRSVSTICQTHWNIRERDMVLLVEHDPVYTVGNRIKPNEQEEKRLKQLGAKFYHSRRGGEITFHGPGQLVIYPIVDIKHRNMGVRCYVHYLEEAIIRTCGEWDIEAGRSEHPGVWVGQDKIAAVGVQVSRGVTMHGLALNCDTDLDWFSHIVPCGIADRGTTSLTKLTGEDVRIEDVIPVFMKHFTQLFAEYENTCGT
eukprot:m.10631 g.10631  ORF g.10631 m.10631 type:complete len:278 (+) comp4295_c1_seq1:23-856(+)